MPASKTTRRASSTPAAAPTLTQLASENARRHGGSQDDALRRINDLLRDALATNPRLAGLQQGGQAAYAAATGNTLPWADIESKLKGLRPDQITGRYGLANAASLMTSMQAVPEASRDVQEQVAKYLEQALKGGLNLASTSQGTLMSQFSAWKMTQPASGLPGAPGTPGGPPGTPPPAGGSAMSSFFDQMQNHLRTMGDGIGHPSTLFHAGMSAAHGDIGSMAGLGVNAIAKVAASDPYAAVALGALGATAGVAYGENVLSTETHQSEQSLSAGLIGATLTSPTAEDRLDQHIRYAGQAFEYNPDTSRQLATGIAAAGVKQSDLVGTEKATMALGRLTGLDPTQLTTLATVPLVQGNQNGKQTWADVALQFDDLTKIAKDAHAPLDTLVQSLQSLYDTAGKGAYSLAGLGAVQAFVGPGIDAGKLMGSSMGATGTNALQQAALLGMNPAQYLAAQHDPAKMLSAVQGFVQRVDHGGATGTLVTEQLLSDSGLLNMQNLSAGQQSTLVNDLLHASPTKVLQDEKTFRNDALANRGGPNGTATEKANDFLSRISTQSQSQVDTLTQVRIQAENIAIDMSEGLVDLSQTIPDAIHNLERTVASKADDLARALGVQLADTNTANAPKTPQDMAAARVGGQFSQLSKADQGLVKQGFAMDIDGQVEYGFTGKPPAGFKVYWNAALNKGHGYWQAEPAPGMSHAQEQKSWNAWKKAHPNALGKEESPAGQAASQDFGGTDTTGTGISGHITFPGPLTHAEPAPNKWNGEAPGKPIVDGNISVGSTHGATTVPKKLLPIFEQAAIKYKVPLSLLLAVASQESSFNVGAYNASSGASGLMQLEPATAQSLGLSAANIMDPTGNVNAGAKLLAQNIKNEHGSVYDALMDYNAGPAGWRTSATARAEAAQYASSVSDVAQQVNQDLAVTVDLTGKIQLFDQSGKATGWIDIDPSRGTARRTSPPASPRQPRGAQPR